MPAKISVAASNQVIGDLFGAILNVGDGVRGIQYTGVSNRVLGCDHLYQFQSLRLFGTKVLAAKNEVDINIGKILRRTGCVETVVDKCLLVRGVPTEGSLQMWVKGS